MFTHPGLLCFQTGAAFGSKKLLIAADRTDPPFFKNRAESGPGRKTLRQAITLTARPFSQIFRNILSLQSRNQQKGTFMNFHSDRLGAEHKRYLP
jgi:hypothetical protein